MNCVTPPEKPTVPPRKKWCAGSRIQLAGLVKQELIPCGLFGALAGQPGVGFVVLLRVAALEPGLLSANRGPMYRLSSESDRTARSCGIFSKKRPKLKKIFVLRLPQGSTMMPARGAQLPGKLKALSSPMIRCCSQRRPSFRVMYLESC